MQVEKISKSQIKWVRSLQQKKVREIENCFLVEGEKMVSELMNDFSERISAIFGSEDAMQLLPIDFPFIICNTKELSQISGLTTPNKLLAIVKKETLSSPKKCRSIVLDGIQDPGNMGTILRLADWYGIEQIICSEDTVDCYNPKVVQASMGAIFRIKVVYVSLNDFLKNTEQPIYGALLEGENYKKVNYTENALLLMGNEGKGIREENISLITTAVTIPRFGKAESLNVSTATAILLSEMVS